MCTRGVYTPLSGFVLLEILGVRDFGCKLLNTIYLSDFRLVRIAKGTRILRTASI